MITENDYLSLYSSMNDEEKKDYLKRVEVWNEETFPHLITLADCWEKVPVKDFDEGLRLASALSKARSFIPVVYRYEAERALRKLRAYLEEIRNKTALKHINARSQYDKTRYRAVVPAHVAQDAETEQGRETRGAQPFILPEVDGRRPEHLAQYFDQLPKELQLRSEELKNGYLALADYRGRIEILAEKGEEFKDDVAILAQKAVKEEMDIRAFWHDVDTFLNTGKMTPTQEVVDDMRRPGDYTKEEIDAMTDLVLQEKCKKARVECDKKYIRRKGTKITDEYRKQLVIRITELMDWNETIPEKGFEHCKAAGVVVDGYNNNERWEEEE